MLLIVVRRISLVNDGIFDLLGTSIALLPGIGDCDLLSIRFEDHCI